MKPHSILVVDDEETILLTLTRDLKKAGYDVDMAASGAAAIEKLKAAAYDLLITDLLMEQISGVDVMRAAKEMYPTLKAVFITGYGRDDLLVQSALRAGALDFIPKPYDRKAFLVKVAEWLGRTD